MPSFAILAFLTIAQAAPPPDDLASPEALVRAFYEGNSTEPAASHDWSRWRALFLPSARIVAILRSPAGEERTVDQSVDEFIAAAEPIRQKRAFREREVAHRDLRYGAVLQRWSAYEAQLGAMPDATVIHGVNSLHLVQAGGRWRIAHVLWTNDKAAGPVPPEYLQDR